MATFEHYDQGTPSYVELMTPDQRAAGEFYGRLFGWYVRRDDMGDDRATTTSPQRSRATTSPASAARCPGMEGHPAFWGVYLAVDDVDAATAKVEGAGGKVEAGPFDVNGARPDVGDPGPDRRARQPVAGQARRSARSAGQRARHPDLERGA